MKEKVGQFLCTQDMFAYMKKKSLILDTSCNLLIIPKISLAYTCIITCRVMSNILFSVGERRMGNKKFPTRTKTYHGDVHLREGMFDLRTLVDRTAGTVNKRG